MARVTETGRGQPAQPPGEGPKVSSELAHNVAIVGDATENLWLLTGHSPLSGRVTVGPPPGDHLNA